MSRAGVAPDLIEPIVGFRAWRLAGGRLAPIGSGVGTWDGGNEVRAICGEAERFRSRTGVVARMPAGRLPAPRFAWHDAPDSGCECGLYAWHAVPDVAPARADPGKWVIGAVAARGAVEVHRDGFRAQFARPVVFAYAGDADRAEVERLGTRHGVAVCAYEELGERALQFGRPVPGELLP